MAEYLEDMKVGRITRFGQYQVTREAVLDFAGKFDPQPFHRDDEAASRTHFGRLSASGWHSCAMAMAMIVEEWTARGHAGLGSPGVEELRWLKPVYPGDTLRLESEILANTPSRSKPDMGSYRMAVTMFNQHAEAVMRFVATILIRRRPA